MNWIAFKTPIALSPGARKRLVIPIMVCSVTLLACFGPRVAAAYAIQLQAPSNDAANGGAAVYSTLLKNILESSHTKTQRILWSAYPASVRGRSFGAVSSNGEGPFSGGW
jgi:hypothetical protein